MLDGRTGRELASVATNGIVVAAVADGHGGWFLGGSFTRLGGKLRIGLAHLLAEGRVDPAWHAWIGGASGRRGSVTGLALSGHQLFIAGAFGRIDGVTRPGLGAVDSHTGAIASWIPAPRVWVDALGVQVAGPDLLVTGGFGITALAIRTGRADRRWDAHLSVVPDAGSYNALVVRGRRVYVAGTFHVVGLRRNGLVALDTRTGAPDRRWAPRVPNCSVCSGFGIVYGVAVSGTRVYVSGAFAEIGGVRRPGIAALDPRTGAVDRRWRPARGGPQILELALVGSRLYLGTLDGVLALDARTGASIPLPRGRSPVEVVTLTPSRNRLLVAGRG